MRAILVLLLLAIGGVAVADPKADKKDSKKAEKKAAAKDDKKDEKPVVAAAPEPPGPDDAKAVAVLERIVAGPDAASRKAAIEELGELAPTAYRAIGAWVERPHQTEQATRRAVLLEIKAAVPDKTGKFSAPVRQTGKELAADDEVDWLKALLALEPTDGLGEVIGDVAAIRALSGTRDIRAARVLFAIAFGEDTIIYRDEVGRYIRRMEPYSVPALTREAQTGKNFDRRRYANWQLERLDRQDPLKALAAAAGDEALLVAVLDVFRETRLREAVHAVWTRVNDDSPRVRAAARAAWKDYITGPPPPPAPRKKLQLAGGKQTKKEKPLWLTYRELADTELRRAANTLLGEDYKIEDETNVEAEEDDPRPKKVEKIDLPEVTKRLYDYFDAERGKQQTAQWAAAKAKADAGDLPTAVAMIDRLIAANPDRAGKAEMAAVYATWAKQLEEKQQWADAAAAYSKAHGLDPAHAAAQQRLAAHHHALGKSLESQGKDGGPDYRRAAAISPDYAPAQRAAARVDAAGRPTWMLFAAVFAGALALALFGIAVVRRRAA